MAATSSYRNSVSWRRIEGRGRRDEGTRRFRGVSVPIGRLTPARVPKPLGGANRSGSEPFGSGRDGDGRSLDPLQPARVMAAAPTRKAIESIGAAQDTTNPS